MSKVREFYRNNLSPGGFRHELKWERVISTEEQELEQVRGQNIYHWFLLFTALARDLTAYTVSKALAVPEGPGCVAGF